MADQIQPYWQNYVNGKWIDGGAGRSQVHNPGTGEALAKIALADAADIDAGVKAAIACHASSVLNATVQRLSLAASPEYIGCISGTYSHQRCVP